MKKDSAKIVQPILAIRISENDPAREQIEQRLRTMPIADLQEVYWHSRLAAAACRRERNMPGLFDYVRGCKTIQRIAHERGKVLSLARK